MAWDDYLEPEVVVAVAVTAAVASPAVRKAFRKGAVYGLAGMLKAKDMLTVAGTGIAQGAREAAHRTHEPVPQPHA